MSRSLNTCKDVAIYASLILVAFSISAVSLSWSVVFIFGLFFCITSWRRTGSLFVSKSHKWLLIFWGCIVLSALLALGPSAEFVYSLRKSRYLVLCFFAVYAFKVVKKQEKYHYMFYALIGSYALASVIGHVGEFMEVDVASFEPRPYDGRISSTTGIMNYGYEAPMVGMLAFSLIYFYPGVIFYKIGAGIIFLGVFFSKTRGGILSILFGLGAVLELMKKRRWAIGILLSVVLFILTVVVVGYLIAFENLKIDSGFLEYFRFGDAFRSESNVLRAKCFLLTAEAFMDSPFWGHGLLSTKNEYELWFSGEFHNFFEIAESTYLQVITDTGLLGTVPFIMFLYFWFKEVFATNQKLFLASFIALLVGFTFHTMFISGNTTAILISIFYCLSQCRINVAEKA